MSEEQINTVEDIHRLEQQRRENREQVVALGLNPYGVRTSGLMSLAAGHEAYDAAADEHHKAHGKEEGYEDRRPVVKIAGRVVLHRDNGKLVWMNLRDETGELQIAASKRDCDELGFGLAKATDLGDVIVAEGPLVKTRTGEVTAWVTSLQPASKCLVPPPEKHAGLQDVELRYRQRDVDLWANPQTMRVFKLRSAIMSRIRRFLDERGYVEVETPMLQTLAGGAAARPFKTHLNALDMQVFMRIAPELYLKRLLVGGMSRVYEVNRNFRNEGLDKQHNPEFTSLELYEAFGNYGSMMELTEELIRELARLAIVAQEDAAGTDADEDSLPSELSLPFGELMIDYGSPFLKVTYGELFAKALGFEMSDVGRAREEALKRGMRMERDGVALADVFVINELFEEVAEPMLDPARPTFVIDYPAALSPLTRPKAEDPSIAERWDLFIAGMEIGPAYTELNDPDIQEAKFKEQLAGVDDEESTFRNFDADFVRALKVGMPPAGGLGLGIDRLVMLLGNQRSIRDVILFPFMKPVGE